MQAGLTKRIMRIEDIANLAAIETLRKAGYIKRKKAYKTKNDEN
jgi:hypothetical protein